MGQKQKWVILLVDDDRSDAQLVALGIERLELPFLLHHVERGNDAIDFLQKNGDYASAPTPDFVLLDLKMPVTSGFDVLQFIKSVDELKHIPVIIWTTSESPIDIIRSYRMYANTYIAKPADPMDFFKTLAQLAEYWVNHARLP